MKIVQGLQTGQSETNSLQQSSEMNHGEMRTVTKKFSEFNVFRAFKTDEL